MRAHFVFEAGATSGMGHYRRSNVLAKQFDRLGIETAMSCTINAGVSMLAEAGVTAFDQGALQHDDILILDGYHFTKEDMQRWQSRVQATVLIDDLADRDLCADIVLNHNLYGATLNYSAYTASLILGGPKWCLTDPAFSKLAELNDRTHILLAFGGGETAKHGVDAARRLAGLTSHNIDVALGTLPAPAPLPGVTFHTQADMVALMSKASVYLGALGVSYLEANAAGLKCVGVQVVDNQRLAAEAAAYYEQSVFGLSEMDEAVKAAIRLAASDAAPPPQLNDGKGSERVARQILAFCETLP